MASLLFAGFAAVLGIWLLASAFVVVNRLFFDRRERRLIDIARALSDPAVASLPPLDRSPAIKRILSRLTRRAVYDMITSTDFPAWLTEICAAYALERWGLQRLVLDASAGRGRRRWRRISALSALGHIRAHEAYELLGSAACDPDSEVAGAAAVILHRLGDHRAAEILIASLGKAAIPSSRIATHVDKFPIPIHDLLRPLLDHPEAETRYWAASLLCRYPEVAGLASQIEALADDPSPAVRKAALTSLGSMSALAAVPLARRALTDRAAFVRSTAVRVLGHQGSVEPDDSRRGTLASWIAPLMADPVWEVRLAVKEYLVQMGPGVWREVARQLKSADEFARNGAAEVLQNLGVLDWALLFADAGVVLSAELREALVDAFHEGGPVMADAAADRAGSDTLPKVEALLTGLRFVGAPS